MNQKVTMRGVVATDARLMHVEDKEFPIVILLENVNERRAMSAAMNAQQAYEFGLKLIESAKALGGIHNG